MSDRQATVLQAREGAAAALYGQVVAIPPHSLIQRIYKGESVPQIAKSLGCHHTAVYAHLIASCPDELRAAQAAKALSDAEDAEERLAGAVDQLTVAREAARVRSAQWRLERALSKIYGLQTTVTLEAGQSWGALLDQVQQRARPALEAEDAQLVDPASPDEG